MNKAVRGLLATNHSLIYRPKKMEIKPCDGCSKMVDFSKQAAGWCVTHKKDYCWECTEQCVCVPGEACRKVFISNPEWIVNLREKMD